MQRQRSEFSQGICRSEQNREANKIEPQIWHRSPQNRSSVFPAPIGESTRSGQDAFNASRYQPSRQAAPPSTLICRIKSSLPDWLEREAIAYADAGLTADRSITVNHPKLRLYTHAFGSRFY